MFTTKLLDTGFRSAERRSFATRLHELLKPIESVRISVVTLKLITTGLGNLGTQSLNRDIDDRAKFARAEKFAGNFPLLENSLSLFPFSIDMFPGVGADFTINASRRRPEAAAAAEEAH